mmetsp:Transcript_28544/g.45465  ORF Transcript_28544/g.45465 Transcript_28544/m.45465 type:complete len:309 (-) Transcript_28544:307-1233(-)
MFLATDWPLATSATALRSSIRPLVQDPIKTLSTSISSTLTPGCSPMYVRALSIALALLGSPSFSGSGTIPVTATTSSGEVPQVTMGATWEASSLTSLSYVAPGSEGRVFQYSTAFSQFSPFGAMGLPFRYSKVTSSGAIIPARAPASMDMLHMVILDSIERPLSTSPAYSITCPVPPAVPITPIIARTRSLEVTPGRRSPSTEIRMFFAGFWTRVWVARTCSTSEVPIPNARAPKAPWVAVWESPHTIVMPGWVKPCSGPTMWTMPWRLSSMPKYSSPNSAQLDVRVSTWSLDSGLSIPLERSVVGTL